MPGRYRTLTRPPRPLVSEVGAPAREMARPAQPSGAPGALASKKDMAGLRKGLAATRGGFIAKLTELFDAKYSERQWKADEMPEGWVGHPLRKDYPLRGPELDRTPRPSFALKSNVAAGTPADL